MLCINDGSFEMSMSCEMKVEEKRRLFAKPLISLTGSCYDDRREQG